MKHLLPFRIYESKTSPGLTKKQEDFMNRYTQGTWSVNPTTGLVDIQGDFSTFESPKKTFSRIKFGNVTGDFVCCENYFESLKGAPREVGGDFDFRENYLKYLKGAPQKVGKRFDCSCNLIQSLEGVPQEVGGDFDCSHNELQSLEGAPQKVEGNFWCSHNELQSLAGSPKKITGRFQCDEFQLEVGKWNMEGWMEVLGTGTGKAKKLILTLPYLQPDWWNSELQRDPGKTVHLLAPWWKDMPENMKSKIKIPPGYHNEFDLFSGFDDLGLF